MPELEVLEAKVPVRTPRMENDVATIEPARSGWLGGPVFSRAPDIFAANMTELLDRAEDPSRMIRMIILEMEETLVEIRSCAARQIADIKEMQRAVGRLDTVAEEWTARAQLALEKGRDDLARAALTERQQAEEIATGLREEMDQLTDVLRSYEADIVKLQAKLREARARQNAIAARLESAASRARANEIMHGSRTAEALAKFEILERRADFAEGRADALALGGPRSLEGEIAELRAAEAVDAELTNMKAALAARAN